MNNIKFRFWSGTKMFYDIENVLECLKQQTYHNEGFKPPHGFDHVGEENSKFMQFTGLKDKNGKEIYEGDVLKIQQQVGGSGEFPYDGKKQERIVVVFWSNFRASWSCKFSELANNDLFRYVQNGGKCEVIGNIYENPELLKYERFH